jgi:hypothetical protein
MGVDLAEQAETKAARLPGGIADRLFSNHHASIIVFRRGYYHRRQNRTISNLPPSPEDQPFMAAVFDSVEGEFNQGLLRGRDQRLANEVPPA